MKTLKEEKEIEKNGWIQIDYHFLIGQSVLHGLFVSFSVYHNTHKYYRHINGIIGLEKETINHIKQHHRHHLHHNDYHNGASTLLYQFISYIVQFFDLAFSIEYIENVLQ